MFHFIKTLFSRYIQILSDTTKQKKYLSIPIGSLDHVLQAKPSVGPEQKGVQGCDSDQDTFFHLCESQVGTQKLQNRKINPSQAAFLGKFEKKLKISENNFSQIQDQFFPEFWQKISNSESHVGSFFKPQRHTPFGFTTVVSTLPKGGETSQHFTNQRKVVRKGTKSFRKILQYGTSKRSIKVTSKKVLKMVKLYKKGIKRVLKDTILSSLDIMHQYT